MLLLMRDIGLALCTLDHDLLRRRRDGRLEQAVAVHVEDLLFGGTAAAVTGFEAHISTRFSVGPTKICVFAFTGLSVFTVDGASTSAASIRVDQEAYVYTIEAIDIRPVRVWTPRSLFDAAELTSYRRATGALLRATGQTTPWLACVAALLARRFTRAVVADLTLANLVITAARRSHPLPLLFPPVSPPPRLRLFVDASGVKTGYFHSSLRLRRLLFPLLCVWGSSVAQHAPHPPALRVSPLASRHPLVVRGGGLRNIGGRLCGHGGGRHPYLHRLG